MTLNTEYQKMYRFEYDNGTDCHVRYVDGTQQLLDAYEEVNMDLNAWGFNMSNGFWYDVPASAEETKTVQRSFMWKEGSLA